MKKLSSVDEDKMQINIKKNSMTKKICKKFNKETLILCVLICSVTVWALAFQKRGTEAIGMLDSKINDDIEEVEDVQGQWKNKNKDSEEVLSENISEYLNYADVDIEAEVENIRKLYYDTQENIIDMDQIDITSGTVGYSEGGEVRKIVCVQGENGFEYSREYFISNGEVYFVFVYKGSEEYRLYFLNDQLIRYIDEKSVTHDADEVKDYREYASKLQEEGYALLRRCSEVTE